MDYWAMEVIKPKMDVQRNSDLNNGVAPEELFFLINGIFTATRYN